jgi:hypothetical protein
MMAKGPDGTNGFAPGWTSRISQYTKPSVQASTVISSPSTEEHVQDKTATSSTAAEEPS